MCIGDQFSYSVLWVVLWTSVTKYYANFWELLLPALWPPSRFRNWRRLLSEAFARCVKNLKRRARVSWYVATLFACPSTTTSGACDHKLANNANAAHMDPIIKKNILLIEVCGTILHIWWTWFSCTNHECHRHVLFW